MYQEIKRITKGIRDIMKKKDKNSDIQLELIEEDLQYLRGSFIGPLDTPYQGGKYIVDIHISKRLPFPPARYKVRNQTMASKCQQRHRRHLPGHPFYQLVSRSNSQIRYNHASEPLSSPEPNDPQDAEVAIMLLRIPLNSRAKLANGLKGMLAP
jgi:ubiquitin-conjugating enzyme (huntingtin interacting protein 2)